MRADDKVELSQVEYYQKFLDRTQKRFLNGCKALAQVRKLMGVENKTVKRETLDERTPPINGEPS